MHSVTYKGKRIYYVDSKDLHNPKIVLSSSSKVAKLSSLAFTIDKTKYREVARVNASIFEMATGTHQGWEFSDVFKTSCKNDTRADVIRFKDGTYLFGDIAKANIDVNSIDWAYSGSHIPLKDGKDVNIVASWRTDYPKGQYCWSFFATRDDGSFLIGALHENDKIYTDDLREFLKWKGCSNAMINDGGGSAELIVDGKVVNRTSERAIANGLFVYEEIQSTKANKAEEVLKEIKKLTDSYFE